MCGRYTLISGLLALKEHFKLPSKCSGVLVPRYNIAPSQTIPIIINNSLEFVNWGIKSPNIPGSLIINAKFETILERPLFKFAFRTNRCLIPGNGFFEWKTLEKKKIPYYIQLREHPILGMAGLLIRNYCVILTTSILNDQYTLGFKERLPLIIKPEHYTKWLTDRNYLEIVKNQELQVNQKNFFYFPVSSQVNNVKFDNYTCIKSLVF